MSDLTICYLTTNRLPQRWQAFHLEHLLRAVDGRPMIVVSAERMELDRPNTQYLIQDPPFCAWNVYKQMLRAALLTETKYFAVAEDDTLYSARHFNDFRPKDDEIAYDLSRWSVFSWKGDQAYFSAIRKCGNFMMCGPTGLVVEALKEREFKHPNGNSYTGEIGRRDVEGVLRVTRRKIVEWYCIEASVNLAHPQGLSPTYIGVRGHERKPGELKAIEIPHWGRAASIAKIYNDGVAEEAGART